MSDRPEDSAPEVDLEGDQICVAGTNQRKDGQRMYCCWTLLDVGEEDPCFQARIYADSPAHAVEHFVKLIAEKRLDTFSWKGPARGKLRRVK